MRLLYIIYMAAAILAGAALYGCEKLDTQEETKTPTGTTQPGTGQDQDDDEDGDGESGTGGEDGDTGDTNPGGDGDKSDSTAVERPDTTGVNPPTGGDDSPGTGPKGDEGDGEGGSQTGDDETTTPGEGTFEEHLGTIDSPYTVAEMLSQDYYDLIINGGSLSSSWVTGYIVGYVSSTTLSENTVRFTADGAPATNILIADTPDPSSCDECMPIQLKTGTTYISARLALNLSDNPSNLGRKILAKGIVRKYFGTVGLQNTRQFSFTE